MAILVVLKLEDNELPQVLDHFDAAVAAVYKRPTVFCSDKYHSGNTKRVSGFMHGRKYGWWVCSICGRPTKRWSENIQAVMAQAYNQLLPCGHLKQEKCYCVQEVLVDG